MVQSINMQVTKTLQQLQACENEWFLILLVFLLAPGSNRVDISPLIETRLRFALSVVPVVVVVVVVVVVAASA